MTKFNIGGLDDLKAQALAITSSLRVFWPQYNKLDTLSPYVDTSCECCYSSNNGTVAFVAGGTKYVIPYMEAVMKILRESGFSEKSFYVPFSNWDYPLDYQAKWENLRAIAAEQSALEFVHDCEQWCDEHGFGSISDELLQKTFVMPTGGVDVKHPYFESTYYPEIRFLDIHGSEMLGHYCTNNGVCAFVYRDGTTRVTRSWDVVLALRSAGYTESSFHVPFSNGEAIQDPVLNEKWKKVSAAA